MESPDPHIACRRVLDAALYEWEERMSADNITVLVVEFDWGEEGSLSSTSMEQIGMGPRFVRSVQPERDLGGWDVSAWSRCSAACCYFKTRLGLAGLL